MIHKIMNGDPGPDVSFRTYLSAAIILLVGCAIGYVARDLTKAGQQRLYTTLREPGWEYINPLLDCEEGRDARGKEELRPIKEAVEEFIGNRLNREWAASVNVYFRELNDGPWFTIGEMENFHPASLLKVPLMMAVLKQAETDPTILKKNVRFDNPELKEVPNPAAKPMEFGRTYSVEELLRQMIVYSDNVATFLLGNTVDLGILSRTYRDLGLTNPYYRVSGTRIVMASSDYMISAYAYASFLRILYNASYLSERMSDKALRLLAETDFKRGLVAGVPQHVKVAHKWGAHLSGANQEVKQLHDCGIVYYPGHPYLLCVMTSGSSMEYLDDAIREVSRVVYENIETQHPEPLDLTP